MFDRPLSAGPITQGPTHRALAVTCDRSRRLNGPVPGLADPAPADYTGWPGNLFWSVE